MIKNYLKTAFRNLMRYRLNTVLTIAGLVLGFTCSLLIMLHVKDESSYDKGFSKAHRIYRITSENIGEENRTWAATSPILGVEMEAHIASIEKVARFHRPYPNRIFRYVSSNGVSRQFEEKNGYYADSTVVEVFDLSFIKGNPQTALTQPDAIVLTEKMALRYFGDEEPLGQTIQDDIGQHLLTVTGIIKDFPFATHLQFDYLISMATFYKYTDSGTLESRGWAGFYNYVLLNDQVSRSEVESTIPEFMVKFYEAKGEIRSEILTNRKTHLQPITAIHLHSDLEKEMGPNGNMLYIYVLSIAALFTLLIASVNFINMATAQAFTRLKEVGVRKVVGARKGQLLWQFLGEAFLLMFLAASLTFVALKLLIPYYNELTGKSILFNDLLTPANLLFMAAFIGLITLIAGTYPSWFASKFDPVAFSKGRSGKGSAVMSVRKGLLIFQFTASILLIFGTIVIHQQMRYFRNKALGFDQDQVIGVRLYGQQMMEQANIIQQELSTSPDIVEVAQTSHLPGDRIGTDMISVVGKAEEGSQMRFMSADEYFISVLQIDLKSGRTFNQQNENTPRNFILNETAVRTLNLDAPIGQRVVSLGDTGEIVGVVRDFHFASLHNKLEPLVIVQQSGDMNYFLLKVKGGKMEEAIGFTQSVISQFARGSLFSYVFLDEKFAHLYDAERRMSRVLKLFTGFAILISCIGLFGLSIYMTRLRTKEVGIRKVLGASVAGISVMLSKDFVKLVFIAILFASPTGWWIMYKWLQNFAYRIEIQWWMFAAAGLTAVVIALLTVGWQAIRAAVTNPGDSLRDE